MDYRTLPAADPWAGPPQAEAVGRFDPADLDDDAGEWVPLCPAVERWAFRVLAALAAGFAAAAWWA